MKKTTAFVLSVVLSGVYAAITVFTPAVAETRQSVGWLPIPKLVERLEAKGYHDVEKIEREGGRYEVRATNRDGERVKLYLDRQTGEQVERQRDRRYSNNNDCNKRRCRDDQPGSPATPPDRPAKPAAAQGGA
ncbi:MAG: PepSY domain-containing protein [Azonexus sp.]|jgi:hypothetical protein|nr:PepSY domain-containing protein [Azonexus sp.]